MCGRFTTTIDLEEIMHYFAIKSIEGEYTPLYNAAPSQFIPVIPGVKPRKLTFFKWGLIPTWAKDKSIGNKLINARAETLLEKPSFKTSFLYRRCAIVADGFLEWKKINKKKQPYRITMKDHRPFAMAGLWSSWTSPEGKSLLTCTIITTQANSLVSELHHRMPVILNQSNMEVWLDTKISSANDKNIISLQNLLKPYSSDDMTYQNFTLDSTPTLW